MREPQYPTFLIIGAMRAGTTTLYRDLLASAGVFFPADKEPSCLNTPEVLTSDGRRRYAALYRRAHPSQPRGDASTSYSKHPVITDVAPRALDLLGPSLRIIYLVRDPIARLISHYRFNHLRGLAGPDINTEVRNSPEYVSYSLYGLQLSLWNALFGATNIRVVQFERYITSRDSTVEALSAFVGGTFEPGRISSDDNYNLTSGPVPSGKWATISQSALYRRTIRPLLGLETRRKIRHALLPRGGDAAVSLRDDTLDYLHDRLRPDMDRLASMASIELARWPSLRSRSG